jgi:hypothetical protein
LLRHGWLLLRLPGLHSIHTSRWAPFPPCRARSMVLGRPRPWKAVHRRGLLHWLGGALENQADDEVLLLKDTRIGALEET